MGALSGAATGASLGSFLGLGGALIGGLIGAGIGAGTSWMSGNAQLNQDLLQNKREKEALSLQLTEAEGLSALNQKAITNQQNINTAQADRYNTQQNLLAGQTVAGAERQMTIFGLQAQAQRLQANQQFIDMHLSRSQTLGQSQQSQATSGLRNTGSILNAETMQRSIADRQIQSASKQLDISKKLVESQLTDRRITATEAAAQLRYAGAEALQNAADRNSSLDIDSETVKERFSFLRQKLNQNIAWSDEDKKWLETQGYNLTLANSFL